MRYPVWNPVHVAIRSPGPYTVRRPIATPPVYSAVDTLPLRYRQFPLLDRLFGFTRTAERSSFSCYWSLLRELHQPTIRRILVCCPRLQVSQVVHLTFSGQTELLGLLVSLRAMPLLNPMSFTFLHQCISDPYYSAFIVAILYSIVAPPRGALHPLILTSMGVPHGQ